MKKVSSEQITDTAIVYTVIDYTETIEWMYQEFSKLVDNEIIPIMEKDEELNEKYINPTEGNKRELFPIVGYFEGVTEWYIISISETAFKNKPLIYQQIKSKIDESFFGS